MRIQKLNVKKSLLEIISIGSEKYGGVSRRRLETFVCTRRVRRNRKERSCCRGQAVSTARKHARSMPPYSRLLCDVDIAEEVEMRRLDGIGDSAASVGRIHERRSRGSLIFFFRTHIIDSRWVDRSRLHEQIVMYHVSLYRFSQCVR